MMQRLTECYKGKVVKILPMEKNSVVESINEKFKSRGAFTVEISRYDHKNKNNRIYTKRLWENVINNQREIWEGSRGLMDHPDNEGSTLNVFCVYHNLRLKESNKTVLADLYLVGDHGGNVAEQIEAGCSVELSTSGLGEIVERDGENYVNEESYMLERPGDNVFNASQQVKFGIENRKKESVENKEQTKKFEEIESKPKKVKSAQTNWLEKTFRKEITKMLKEAEKTEDVEEKLIEYIGIKEWFSDEQVKDYQVSDLLKKTNDSIELVNTDITNYAKKGVKFDEIVSKKMKAEKENKELKEEFEELSKKCLIFKKLITEMKSINFHINEENIKHSAIMNGMFSCEEYDSLTKHYKETKEELNVFRLEKIKLVEKNKHILSEYNEFKEMEFQRKEKENKIVQKEIAEKHRAKQEEEVKIKEQEIIEIKKQKILEKKSKEKDVFSFENKEEIMNYYYSLVERDEGFIKYRKKFMDAKSMRDAKKIYADVCNTIYEIDESEYNQFDHKEEETINIKEESNVWSSYMSDNFYNKG